MTSTEAEISLHKQLSDQFYNPGDMWNNLQMTTIPQTTWYLFVLLQWWKHVYPTGQSSITVQEKR